MESTIKKRFKIVLQRLFETTKPENYGYKLKRVFAPQGHRYKDLNTNTVGSLRWERSTVSTWTVYDTAEGNKEIFKCYCVENEGPSSDVSGSDLRIPPGEYILGWWYSGVTLPKDPYIFPSNPKSSGRHRALMTLKPNESNTFYPNGFVKTLGRHASRGCMIHIGTIPQHSEGCLLLVSSLETKKNKITGEKEYTGKGFTSTAAVLNFYKIVDKYGPQNFVLLVLEPNMPPPPPYETNKTEIKYNDFNPNSSTNMSTNITRDIVYDLKNNLNNADMVVNFDPFTININ